MSNRGMTLVELIVVVSVVGILAIALGFSYVGWQGAYKAEKVTKDIYTDLMDARTRALTRSRMYFADFNFPAPAAGSGRYRIASDENVTPGLNDDGEGDLGANGVIDAGHTFLPSFPKTVDYAISTDAGGILTFQSRGFIAAPNITEANPDVAICLIVPSPPEVLPGELAFRPPDLDYDCIEISQTKISMGKLTIQIIMDEDGNIFSCDNDLKKVGAAPCDADNCVAK